jgi:hypothetical protein
VESPGPVRFRTQVHPRRVSVAMRKSPLVANCRSPLAAR